MLFFYNFYAKKDKKYETLACKYYTEILYNSYFYHNMRRYLLFINYSIVSINQNLQAIHTENWKKIAI